MGKKIMAYVRNREGTGMDQTGPKVGHHDPDSSQKKNRGRNKVEFLLRSFMLNYKHLTLVLASVQGDTLGCE